MIEMSWEWFVLGAIVCTCFGVLLHFFYGEHKEESLRKKLDVTIRTEKAPKKTKKRKALDCRHCGAKNCVAIIPDPKYPSMMKDKLHCFACGKTWPVSEDAP